MAREASTEQTVGRAELDEVGSALEELGGVLEGESDLGTLLQRVCEQVVRAIPGAEMASITLVDDGTPSTAASTDPRAYELDIDQYQAAEGPCLEAVHTRQIVRVNVAAAPDRWPAFTKTAREAGVTDYLAAPLDLENSQGAALNLYSNSGRSFDDVDGVLLDLYISAADTVLRTFSRYRQAKALTVHLREALASRAVIDQAKGVLMGSHRMTADEAFAALVRQSQRENVKVRELAARIVQRVSRTPSTG